MDQETYDKERLTGAVEALLFVYGEPIKLRKLSEVLGAEESRVREALLLLSEKTKGDHRGINVVILDDKATLLTKPELSEIIKRVMKEEMDSELTPASLETLAIIAYLGPVPRHEIDFIRGVNSSFTLRNLMVRGLVSKEVDKSIPGGYLYNITFDFMKHIGVNSQEELADFSKYRLLMKDFFKPKEQQGGNNHERVAEEGGLEEK